MNKRPPTFVLYGFLAGLAMLSPACKSVPESEKPAAGVGPGGKVRTFGTPGEFAQQSNKTAQPAKVTPSPPAPSDTNGVLYGKPATSSDSLRKSDFKK